MEILTAQLPRILPTANTLTWKWPWRRRPRSRHSVNNGNRHKTTEHGQHNKSRSRSTRHERVPTNSFVYSFLLVVLVANSLIQISGHPLNSKIGTRAQIRSTSSKAAAATATRTGSRATSSSSIVTSHQTECDWRGRGGSTLVTSNVPTALTSTTAQNSHHHRDGGGGDNDFGDIDTGTDQRPVIQSYGEFDQDLLTSSALVQTINLRCTSGSVHWEDPSGGLKISISPSVRKPYRLCLENSSTLKAASVRILLQQSSSPSTSGDEDAYGAPASLLPILTTTNSKCYQMYARGEGDGDDDGEGSNSNYEPTVIYIEHSHSQTGSNSRRERSSQTRTRLEDGDIDILDDVDGDELLINQNHLEDDFPHQDEGEDAGADEMASNSNGNEHENDGKGNTISLSYEIESFRGDGDPCTPCSEAEVLKTYCTADAVARGSIVKISPAHQPPSQNWPMTHNQADEYDSIYIKSTFVVHQTQPLFTHYNSLSHFLNSAASSSPLSSSSPFSLSSRRFNTNQPQRRESLKGDFYGGIIHHPSSCASSIGDDEQYLWLIKFRFGRPITDCVMYWDTWKQIVQRNQAECPVSLG